MKFKCTHLKKCCITKMCVQYILLCFVKRVSRFRILSEFVHYLLLVVLKMYNVIKQLYLQSGLLCT